MWNNCNLQADKIYGLFSSIGYNSKLSSIFTNLCVYRGGLPQGAPTSPKLANLVCARLDTRIQGYSGPKGIVYTRYADDLTLSSQSIKKIQNAKLFIKFIVSSEGLALNDSKTMVCGTKRRKKITGLVVSEHGVGIGREKLRNIRASIHQLFTGKNDDVARVNSLLVFVYGVDKKSYTKLYRFIDKMKSKYPLSSAGLNLNMKISKS